MYALLESVSSLLLAYARNLWKRLPFRVRRLVDSALRWFGLAYASSYIATYNEIHDHSNFAGNLLALQQQYPRSSAGEKEKIAEQFNKIMNSLVMPNGVNKATRPMRYHSILAKVLADERCRLQKSAVTVIDVPSSSGVVDLDIFAILSQYYTIRAYVLGDLCFNLYYDPDRECVFDEDFNLLQVKMEKRFFSIYRGHSLGDMYSPLSRALLFPLDVVAWYLKKKHVYSTNNRIVPLFLIHPDVQARLSKGDFSLSKTDVFKDIGEHYDLILSFNLLQRSYFTEEQIARGVQNLTEALNEQGFLIMGNDGFCSVAQKREGKLVVIREESV
jgi:hypothetical protein